MFAYNERRLSKTPCFILLMKQVSKGRKSKNGGRKSGDPKVREKPVLELALMNGRSVWENKGRIMPNLLDLRLLCYVLSCISPKF